ncbi:hypothetical protein V5G28_025040 [Scytonema sp. PRP1]
MQEQLGLFIRYFLILIGLLFSIAAFMVFLSRGQVIELIIVISVYGLSPFVLYRIIVKRTTVFQIIQKARTGVAKKSSYKWLAMIKELIKVIFIEEKKQPLYYGVSISTNDGKKVSIPHYDEEYIENIMAKIYEVMENQDTPASYHFVVEGDLIQQSGNFDVGVNQGNMNSF